MAEIIEIEKLQERVILVGVSGQEVEEAEESLQELADLVHTAGAEVVGTVLQKRDGIHPGTYVGTGKLEELAGYLYEKETITGEEFMEILNK